MLNDRVRQFRQKVKKLLPKKVSVVSTGMGGFCKYGKVRGGRGSQSESVIIVPIEGNQNDNWRVG